MQVGRLKYEKPSRYCNKVFIGNWFEDRCAYEKQRHTHQTIYETDYTPKPYSANDPAVVWDQKFQADGKGARILIDHHGTKYLDNMTTTYDLSYNHFPKWYKGPIHRHLRFRLQRHEPDEDYVEIFGNITNYGIHERKKEQWRCEKLEPRTTPTTTNQDLYLPPKTQDLLFKRWGIPIQNSSIMNKSNTASATWKLRGMPMCSVTASEDLIEVPREKRCNPITWECPHKERIQTRCLPPKN